MTDFIKRRMMYANQQHVDLYEKIKSTYPIVIKQPRGKYSPDKFQEHYMDMLFAAIPMFDENVTYWMFENLDDAQLFNNWVSNMPAGR